MIYTYLPKPKNYIDRLSQLNSIKKNINVFVKVLPEDGDTFKCLNFILLPNKFYSKSIFLPFFLFFYILRCDDIKNIIIIDWFKSFYLLIFLNVKSYIYSPVISDYGFVYKALKNKNCISLRYFFYRLKASFIDFILVRYCTKLVVQSNDLVLFYVNIYKINSDKVIVNYNDFSQSFKSPKFNQRKRIGFVGNLELHKGLQFIIEGSSYFKDYDFMIAGSKNSYYNKYYTSLFECKNVFYLGVLDRKEIKEFFEKIDVLLFPSFHEGSPRVIMEFIEYNKPIIYSKLEGLDYLSSFGNTHILKSRTTHNMEDILSSNIFYNSKRNEIHLKKGLYEYLN